jgi:hypothetical protein
MGAAPQPSLPLLGSVVPTACRGYLLLEADTPTTIYRGRRIYFCLPDCLKSFVQNPSTSCLAGDPLLEND